MKLQWEGELPECAIGLAWSKDKLVAGLVDGKITLLSTADGSLVQTKTAHSKGMVALAGNHSRTRAATVGQDSLLKIWECGELRELSTYKLSEDNWGELVAWSFDDRYLAASSGTKIALLSADGVLQQCFCMKTTPLSLAWHPNKQVVAVGGYGGVTLYDPTRETPINRFHWDGAISSVSWGKNGKYIVCGTLERSIHGWNVNTKRDFEMTGFSNKVQALSWHESGDALAASGGPFVSMWDFRSGPPLGKEPILISGHLDTVSTIACAPIGSGVVSGGGEGRVLYWTPLHDDADVVWQAYAPIVSLQWSADAQYCAAASCDGMVGYLAA